jgi:sterol desaturase/sphingolipid hydroxylase (fatty acid hydroxylase superfamily)
VSNLALVGGAIGQQALISAGVLAAIAATLTLCERFNPGTSKRSIVSAAERISGARWFVVYLAYAPLTAYLVARGANALAHRSPLYPSIGRSPLVIRSTATMVVCELTAYWTHRLMHAQPKLWRFHSAHHRAATLRWWATFRFHPIDGALMHATPIFAAAILGSDAQTIAPYLALVLIVTAFSHADVWIPDRWLSSVVATPSFHRRHHDPGHDRTNFALVLPVLDRLFHSENRSSPTRLHPPTT